MGKTHVLSRTSEAYAKSNKKSNVTVREPVYDDKISMED